MTGWRSDRRGVAALEFALVAPVLLTAVAGLADFTLVLADRMQIASAVGGGTEYAFNQGQVLAGTQQSVLSTDVQSKVASGTGLAGVTVTVTGPGTYCVSSGALVTGTVGTACPNGNPPGTYMIITATYQYHPMLPFYSMMATTTLTESASVRLY